MLLLIFFISYRFRMDFGRIWGEFWWMLGGFTPDFLDIFRIFIESRDFVENSVFPRKNQYFAGFLLFKIRRPLTGKVEIRFAFAFRIRFLRIRFACCLIRFG